VSNLDSTKAAATHADLTNTLYANNVALALLDSVVSEFITRAGEPSTWDTRQVYPLLTEILSQHYSLHDRQLAVCTRHVYTNQVLPRLQGAQAKWAECKAHPLIGTTCPECGAVLVPMWLTSVDDYVPGCPDCAWHQRGV